MSKQVKLGTFLSAGYAAFHLAYFDVNAKRVIQPVNPYKEAPFSDLWAKGWRDAEREFKRGVPFRHVGYTDNRVYDPNKKIVPFKPKPKFIQQVGRGNRVVSGKPVIKDVKDGVNLNRLNNRFNNKYRTKV